jgi:hypothetical protein
MTFIASLFKGAWGYVAAGLATLVAILAALSKAKKAGRDEVIVKNQERQAENVQKATEVERKVESATPDANRERLRKWTVG